MSFSIGCRSQGESLYIENSYVYGVHSGINSFNDTVINGGIYEGYGHGGIYFSGCNATHYIFNAIVRESPMPDGYESKNGMHTQNGMYIGGGKNETKIVIYMDACQIFGTKNSIVLRGTSGEVDNTLYVSNTSIYPTNIRIDSDTHYLYIGIGCNFNQACTQKPNNIILTQDQYNKT